MLSRPGTASRGYRRGRLPERPARDGDALQHGFGGATVELQRSGRRWAEIDLPAGGVGNAASGQRQAVARYTRRRNGLRTLGTLSPPAAHSSFLTLCWRELDSNFRSRDAREPDELTQNRPRCSSPCKLRQGFELASPGRVRWAMTSSILLIGVRGSSGRACGREFATARVRSECRQGRSVFLAAPGREPFRQPDAVVLLRRLLHRAGNARSL
jgi:hypothetical protein